MQGTPLEKGDAHPSKLGHSSFGWGVSPCLPPLSPFPLFPRPKALQPIPVVLTLRLQRRICPGADLAQNNLFIALARILWCFAIRPKKGVAYDIDDYVGGFNIRPRHFECEITVRSARHEKVLKEEYQGARAVMDRFPLFKEEVVV